MFAGLRHYTFVGCDDEKGDVDSGRAGEHRTNKGFVSRNIDYADGADSFENQWSKSEIDCNSATFLFRETISVDTGKSFYECGLSMIDVTRSSQDHAALPPHAPCSHTRNARSSRSVPRCSWKNSRSNR